MQKECSKCQISFETKGEHVHYCPSCSKTYRIEKGIQKPEGWERKTSDRAEYMRQYRKDNPDKYQVYEKGRAPRTAEQERAKYVRKMKRLHGDNWEPKQTLPQEEKDIRNKTRERFRDAIKRGKVTRQPCEVCGEVKSDGHHTDYSKPLEVVWLCRKHHVEAHHPKQ